MEPSLTTLVFFIIILVFLKVVVIVLSFKSSECNCDCTLASSAQISFTDACEMTNTDKGKRHHNYCSFYEQELAGKDILRILEIGIGNGGRLGYGRSLQAWSAAYPNATVVGLDIDSKALSQDYNSPQNPGKIITRFADAKSTQSLLDGAGDTMYDLIIDDGSHAMSHQQNALHILWQRVKPGGTFIMEDLQSSYRENHPSMKWQVDHKPTTIEVLKDGKPSTLLPNLKQIQDETERLKFFVGPQGKLITYTAVLHKSKYDRK